MKTASLLVALLVPLTICQSGHGEENDDDYYDDEELDPRLETPFNNICFQTDDFTVVDKNRKSNATCTQNRGFRFDITCSNGFPASLGHFVRSLTIIDFNISSLGHQTQTGEKAFVESDTLVRLTIKNSSIVHICKSIFQAVPSLKYLDLSHNKLSILRDDTLADLEEIEEINFSHNEVEVVRKFVFQPTKFLKKLDLSFNFLKRFAATLPQTLNYLNLSHNHLMNLRPVDEGIELQILDLCYNPIKKLRAGNEFKKLKVVCIANSTINCEVPPEPSILFDVNTDESETDYKKFCGSSPDNDARVGVEGVALTTTTKRFEQPVTIGRLEQPVTTTKPLEQPVTTIPTTGTATTHEQTGGTTLSDQTEKVTTQTPETTSSNYDRPGRVFVRGTVSKPLAVGSGATDTKGEWLGKIFFIIFCLSTYVLRIPFFL